MFVSLFYITFLTVESLCKVVTMNTNDKTAKIGGLFTFGSDGSKMTLEEMQNIIAFKCSVDFLNTNYRILRETLLTYTVLDSGTGQSRAVDAAEIMRKEQCMAVIGPAGNEQIRDAAPALIGGGISLVSYEGGSISLQESFYSPNAISVWPPDSFQTRAMADILLALGWTFVAAVYTHDNYGYSGRRTFGTACGRARIRITCQNTIDTTSLLDLQKVGDCLDRSDAKIVVLWMSPKNAANVIAYLRTRERANEFVFFASSSWARMMDFKDLSKYAEEALELKIPIEFLNGTLAIYPTIGDTAKIEYCLRNTNPNTFKAPFFLGFWEDHFKCSLSDDSLPVCSPKIEDRNKPCKCYGNESLQSKKYISSAVNYIYDSVHFMGSAMDKIIYRCTTLKSKNFCAFHTLTSEDIMLAMQELSYRGETGPIQFSKSVFRRKSTFDIFQQDAEGRQRKVGTWSVDGTELLKGSLKFKTPGIPESAIIPDESSVASGNVTVIGIFIANIFILLILGAVFVFFIIKKDSGIVRRANLLFLSTLNIGLIFVTLSSIIWSMNPSRLVCISKAFFLIVGMGIIAAAVCGKAHHSLKYYISIGTISKITPNVLIIGYLVAISLIELVLFGLYCFAGGILDPVVVQSLSDNTYQYYSCQKEATTIQNIILVLIIAFNAVLFISPLIFYIFATNLKMPEGEQMMTLFMLINLGVLFSLLTPIYLLNNDRKGSLTRGWLVRSLGMVAFVAFTIISIFLPKIKYVFKEEDEGDKDVIDPEERIINRTEFGKPGFVSIRKIT
eukprot:GHVP01069830.1.p1 GENE.GHVP01069830.1~~GHVP01069830.1.p1  ORF type:complete len:785 (+),score=101.74 GHVP01069830.1:854-3208(+)